MKIFRNSIFAVLVCISSVTSLYAQDIEITNITTTPVTCGTGSDGTITVTITGGVGPYSYLLSKGAIPVESAGPIASTTFTFTGHDKYTNYWVIVSDESPAAGDFEFATITGPNPINITSAAAFDISCNNVNDGSITVTAMGEGGNFIYDLTGPVNQTNELGTFSGLPQGNYGVTVSDKDGCPSTDATGVLTINNPSPVSISTDNVTDILCYGDNSGSISITPTGGTPAGAGTGYSYEWTGPNGYTSNAEDITNLEAGDYFVTVFDGNLCSVASGPFTINQPTQLAVLLNGSTDVTCNGGADGTAIITPSGGAGGYTFSWDGQSNGLVSSDEDPVNLVADIYDLTIFDGNGCSITFPSFVTITEPLPFGINIIGTTDVTCNGETDGTATISPEGGTPPYSFFWTGAGSGFTSTDEDPVNMPADTYSLTITDSRGCSMPFGTLLTILEPPPLVLTVDGFTDVSCFGGNDGSANITVGGGTAPYLFSWSGTGTGHTSNLEDPDDLLADNYDLIVTDNNGCVHTFPGLVTIAEPLVLLVVVNNITPVNCNGESTGAIEITPSGGTPLYTFAWTGPNGFTATTEDLSGLEAGNYSLTITDANGCSQLWVDLATVNENTSMTASFTVTDITCNGAADGTITTLIAGGTPNYSFLWQGPSGYTSTLKDISGLLPGSYLLTVTDDLGCIQMMTEQVITEPPPIVATATQVNVNCFGAANGSIDLTPSGGIPPYAFVWTGPSGFTATTEDLSGLEPGAYSVTITDSELCSTPFTNIVFILEPAQVLVTPSKTDISCAGAADGTIGITVTGGTLPYTFAWTGPSGFTATTEDISGLEAGTYSLTITDGNVCVNPFPNLETILEPLPIVATYVSHQDVLCSGNATGSIEIETTGGTAPLLFSWTNSSGSVVSTDEDPVGLIAETYSLNVSDINGCLVSYPNLVVISEPPPLISTLLRTNITCFGDGNGVITVTTVGGAGPYEYSRVSDAGPYQSGTSFPSLGPGLYTIWTRDANLCVVTQTITIQEPSEIQIVGETIGGQNLCYGNSAGRISIDLVTGGVEPYVYSINGGVEYQPTNIFSNLPAGFYQTMVLDASGCSVSGNLNEITEPLELQIGSYTQEDINSCYGAPEGRITILGTGGSGIITYTLNGTISNTSGDFQNLAAGAYLVTMEDANGCLLDTSVVIQTPPEIIVDNIVITDVTTCFGDATGAVAVAGSGGTGTLTYSINGGAYQATGIFIGLTAGSFNLTLKDDNDCTRDSIISIAEPAPIAIISESFTPITCSGADDGTIQITASGGTPLLNYTLTPGIVTNNNGLFTGLTPDIYTVSVNDALGCGPAISSPLTITDPPLFVLDSVTDQDISCFEAGDGSITVFVSGGVPPYLFSVDNQANWSVDSLIGGLNPGTYEVFAQDANLCVVSAGTYILTDPPQITALVDITDIADCAGDTTGVIDVTGSGGTGNLEYSLDGISFQPPGTFSNLPAGNYTIYVRDESGCSISIPATIDEPDPVTATITKTDATFGNLGSITISGTSGGTSPYLYSIEGDTGTFTTDMVYADLEANTYDVVIKDFIGCTYRELVEIRDVLPLDVVVNVVDVSCFGLEDGSIEFVAQDAEGAVEYSIDSGKNFDSESLFENLPGDITYYLAAMDAAGKVFTDTVFISEPTEVILSMNITQAECNAFSETGSIDVTVTGGSGSYTYLWSDGSSAEDRTNIGAGLYILETTDGNLCTRTDSMTVTSEVVVMAYAGEDTTICYNESMQLDALGGHTATWDPSPFITDPNIANPVTLGITENTTFTVTITEEISVYGCYNRDSMEVTLFPITGIEASIDTFVIIGTSVQLEATGGLFLDYRWDPATGLDNPTIYNPIATPLETVRYYVYATSEYGCVEMDSVWVEVIEDLKAYNAFSPNGDAFNPYFEIENAERFPNIQVEVYNRWGHQLFSSVGYDSSKRWDGTTNGKDVPVGTYYYVIIPYSGAKPITGNVTIIR